MVLFQVFRLAFDFFPRTVASCLSETRSIDINFLIEGRNKVASGQSSVEPRSHSQGRRKNDAFTQSAICERCTVEQLRR